MKANNNSAAAAMASQGGSQLEQISDEMDKIMSDGQASDNEYAIEEDLMVGELDSTKVDHKSLLFTFNHVQNCINHIMQNVNNVKVEAKNRRHTFGNDSTGQPKLLPKD